MRRSSASRRSRAAIAGSCHRGDRTPLFSRTAILALVDRKRRAAAAQSDPNERLRWHQMLTHIATARGYKPGWTAYKFREKFGTWPPGSQRRAARADGGSAELGP